jgi:hypothetical protein
MFLFCSRGVKGASRGIKGPTKGRRGKRIRLSRGESAEHACAASEAMGRERKQHPELDAYCRGVVGWAVLIPQDPWC